MNTFAKITIGAVIGSSICCAIVHRRVIAALVTGSPMPEPPEWHKHHPAHKK